MTAAVIFFGRMTKMRRLGLIGLIGLMACGAFGTTETLALHIARVEQERPVSDAYSKGFEDGYLKALKDAEQLLAVKDSVTTHAR